MTVDLEQFRRWTTDVDRKRRDRDRAEGALEQAKDRLRKDFGFESAADADERLAELERTREELEKKIGKKMEAFGKKWEGKL